MADVVSYLEDVESEESAFVDTIQRFGNRFDLLMMMNCRLEIHSKLKAFSLVPCEGS
jgi:hypothetical protein